MIILNDLHLGVNRQAGTTPFTQVQLRDYLMQNVRDFFDQHQGCEITINGDLFDGFEVDTTEVVRTFETFADWLRHDGNRLNLIAGNHDWNPRANKLSSFHLLCHFLKFQFQNKVHVFDGGYTHISDNVWCIPHQANQDLFNVELKKAWEEDDAEGKFLLLHCNYRNTFAENSDHSLNINDEQVAALMRAGWSLVLGHEHQGYTLRNNRVIVVGNQFPSSCADCIDDNVKLALSIDGTHDFIETWRGFGNYIELPWTEIPMFSGPEKFIRVIGDCAADQASEMVSAVAKFRQKSSAFVVSNAVKVAGMAEMDTLASLSMENISKFNVTEALMDTLDEEEQKVVKGLLQ